MVIRCSHCKGMMRLDESRIPKGGGVQIRCPRCKEMDYVEDPSLSKTHEITPYNETSGKMKTRTSNGREPSQHPISGNQDASKSTEPSIPDDAFQGFRFPAEREANQKSTRRWSTWLKVLVWSIVSLAVVAFFALLVNIVLSGPGGPKPFGGEAPPGVIDRQSPSR